MSGGELSRAGNVLRPVVNCSVFPLSGGEPDSELSSGEYMPGGESPGFPLSGGFCFLFVFVFVFVLFSLSDSV